MTPHGAPRLLLLGLLCGLVLSGCYGQADLQTNTPFAPEGEKLPEDEVYVVGRELTCDGVSISGESLESVAQQFSTTVHPLMMRSEEGCVTCHAPEKGRTFRLSADPLETFYDARGKGLFRNAPSTIFDRLTSLSPDAGMPLAKAKWHPTDIRYVRDVVCKLTMLKLDAPDEEFPRQLLLPYSPPGDAGVLYENTFITYPQLQGKVSAVFNDDWKRSVDGGTVDRFADNRGLLGGVDFSTYFNEPRVAKPEFLLALDSLAVDVCARAAQQKVGPFVGYDPLLPLEDRPAPSTLTQQAESFDTKTNGSASNGGLQWALYSNGEISHTFNLPSAGGYTVNVRARGTTSGVPPVGPSVSVRVDGVEVAQVQVDETALTDHPFSVNLPAGPHALTLRFTNDANDAVSGDRNLFLDLLSVTGPSGGSTGTSRVDAARATVGKLYQGILYRAPNDTETTEALALVSEIKSFGLTLQDSWQGLCEALVHHPDFLFTRPPHHDVATGAEKRKLLLVKLTQDLLARPPTQAELDALEGGKTFAAFVDEFLAGTAFRDRYFYKLRIRTEADGTVETDEPARLWTHLTMTGKPAAELLVGDYSVDPSFAKATRPAFHQKTGVLTMKGFIKNKQGLPHYNYSARVMSDFLGTVFEVPQAVFDQRQTATASSTVDTESICFACHQNLTPLAYQRLRWNDQGEHREVDDDGVAIDDTDRELVKSYAFKGQGLEAFSTQAVKKEAFVRRVINTNFEFLFGRPMRHETDERVLYKQLWDVMTESQGDQKALLKAILLSPTYQQGS